MPLWTGLPGGYPGQRLRILPSPLIASAARDGVTARLLVTDAGYFPRAQNHGRTRPLGSQGAIVILCTAGRGWCEADGRRTGVRAGQALVIPPHRPHSYGADHRDPWTIWWIHAIGADVPVLLEAIGADVAETVVTVRDERRAVDLFDHAVSALERDETRPSLLDAAGAGWALYAMIAADRTDRSAGTQGPVADAQAHLRAHLDSPLDLPSLARRYGLSTSHFAALFRASTGGGVVEYVKRLRMARARELLVTTTWGVGDIAASVGYKDAFYFSRQFRSVSGTSPSDYRQAFGRQAWDLPGEDLAAPDPGVGAPGRPASG